MKIRTGRFLIFCLSIFLVRCAAAPLSGNTHHNDDEYKKDLKYSAQLHSQPIDILKESFNPPKISKEKRKTEPTKNKRQRFSEKAGKYSIQIASFNNEENAKQYLRDISAKNSTFEFRLFFSENLWRVLTEKVEKRNDAEQLLQRLKMSGFSGAWIVQF
jgi:cell division septation protein DedD